MDIINVRKPNKIFFIIIFLVIIYFVTVYLYKHKSYKEDIKVAKKLFSEYPSIIVGTRGETKIVSLNFLDSKSYYFVKGDNNQYYLDTNNVGEDNLEKLKGIKNYLQKMDFQNFVAYEKIENDNCIQCVFWYSTVKQIVHYKNLDCIKKEKHLKYNIGDWAVREL